MEALKRLHKTLKQRKRPEDVAQMILELSGNSLSLKEKNILGKAAKGSLKNTLLGYTSMMQEFAVAIGAEKQIKKAQEIFELDDKTSIDFDDINEIEAFIREASSIINKKVGFNNFLSDRLNKEQRKEKGLEISKRNYNKKWRLLKRLECKLFQVKRTIRLCIG